MNKIKFFLLAIAILLGTSAVGFVPTKAAAAYHNNDNYGSSHNRMIVRNYYPYDMNNYNFRPYCQNAYYSQVTYPRTVYLIDASNSANQLNIINATRNGSTTAAYIIVRPEVYNRVVTAYNQLGVVSVRVDRSNGIVTFYTVNGTFSTYAVNISYQ